MFRAVKIASYFTSTGLKIVKHCNSCTSIVSSHRFLSTLTEQSRKVFESSQKVFLANAIKSTKQRQEVFELLQKSAERGDNIGIDEFPSINEIEEVLNNNSKTLAFSTMESNTIECCVIVEPCRHVRSVNPIVCTVYLITSAELSNPEFLREFVRVAEEFLLESCQEYNACVTNVFVPCLERMLAMREEGFLITACIPEAGELSGTKGLVGNYLMYKELGNSHTTILRSNDCEEFQTNGFVPHFKTLSLLPFNYTMHDGTELTIRAMETREIDDYYLYLKSDIDDNNGYGCDEIPSKSYFKKKYLHNCYAFVAELSTNRKTVAYFNLCNSTHQRTIRPVLSDGNITVLPEFRSKRWSIGIMEISVKISHKLGYSACQADTDAKNLPSANGMFRFGNVVGILPKGIRYQKYGWIDLLLFRCD